MIIEITPAEKRQLWSVAKELYKAKHPSAMEKYKLDGRHPVIRDYEGFLGELAVAKYFDVPYEAVIYKLAGDKGCDLEVDGMRIGVKATTFQPKPLLLVKANEKKADVYYLVEIFKDTGKVNIAGWLDVDTIVSREPRKVHTNGPLNHVFSYDELKAPLAEGIGTRLRPASDASSNLAGCT